jgi:hypothetical protein
MTDNTSPHASAIGEFLTAVRRFWLSGLISFAVVFGLGIIWLSRQVPAYSIDATVTDKKQSLGLSSGSGLGGLGGAFSLLGVGKAESGVLLLQESVYSAELADRLERRHKLSRIVFSDRWNAARQTWYPPSGLVPAVRNALVGGFGVDPKNYISKEDLRLFVQGIEFRQSDVAPSAYHVRMNYPRAAEGQRILGLVIAEADMMLRERQITDARSRQAYLVQRLRDVEIVEQRNALTQLMSENEMKNLVSNADRNFSIDVMSVPKASERPTSPRYLLVLALLLVAAAGAGVLVVWTRGVLAGQARPTA